jgi:hypothetical protein
MFCIFLILSTTCIHGRIGVPLPSLSRSHDLVHNPCPHVLNPWHAPGAPPIASAHCAVPGTLLRLTLLRLTCITDGLPLGIGFISSVARLTWRVGPFFGTWTFGTWTFGTWTFGTFVMLAIWPLYCW